eukprot:UN28281
MLRRCNYFNVIDGINFMPAVILTAKLCPKNLEATTYAMLAGFQNFGRQVATAVGTNIFIFRIVFNDLVRCVHDDSIQRGSD